MIKEKIINSSQNILNSPIEYLKGVGPQRGELFRKELNIHTFGDLLEHFPFRHVDKTSISPINSIRVDAEYLQVAGRLTSLEMVGERRGKRLVGTLADNTGEVELVWFQGANWIQKSLEIGQAYLVYGKPGFFQGNPQIVHPEIEKWTPDKKDGKNFLEPVYPSTEKLKARSLGGRQIGKLTAALFLQLREKDIEENLPAYIIEQNNFPSRFHAYRQIHFPENLVAYQHAAQRLKFEELFFAQLSLAFIRLERNRFAKGVRFEMVGDLFNGFYKDHLPFELTNAQKRVIREIRNDTATGKQMNRLLQGDVGSGKTIVALLTMLLAIDNGYQACLMAPTEILASQHFDTISQLLSGMPVQVALLTGSTKAAARRKLLKELEDGHLKILIGTHAVIEDPVKFQQLGIVIIDEQHRFGVAQRARLWEKAIIPPHMLVMTATPIPRTLAMTAYGDLDYSVIDELPPGRQPVTTIHRFETQRARVMEFLKSEIAKGRQVFIIFPLITESEKLDYENLMEGYEKVKGYFPEPKYWISMVHGRQPADMKESNMQRFVDGITQILVSTTVIEVGVNIPNASVMVIESAEKFGLSQLHQLRGRVGRGAEKSYCILLTGSKIGQDARQRMQIITNSQNGFEIAEKDLELRGPGDIQGTRQSGLINFKLADIIADREILLKARESIEKLLSDDPDLKDQKHLPVKNYLHDQRHRTGWGQIA